MVQWLYFSELLVGGRRLQTGLGQENVAKALIIGCLFHV